MYIYIEIISLFDNGIVCLQSLFSTSTERIVFGM